MTEEFDKILTLSDAGAPPDAEVQLNHLVHQVVHILAWAASSGLEVTDANVLEVVSKEIPHESLDWIKKALRAAGLAEKYPESLSIPYVVQWEVNQLACSPVEAAVKAITATQTANGMTLTVFDQDGNQQRVVVDGHIRLLPTFMG